MVTALLIATVLSQAYYTPEEAQAVFAEANAAYAKGDFDGAVERYQRLVDRGFGGADVLYNLGTTYLSQGKLGEAVLYLEKARRAGSDEDVEANLDAAKARQLDQVIGGGGSEPFLQRLAAGTSGSTVSAVFLATWVLGFAALIAARFLRRRVLTFAAAGFLAIAVASGAVVAAHAYVDSTVTEAVIIANELRAYELPQESAKISFEVHAGLKVRLLETSGKFVRIRLPNGLEGWAVKQGVAEI
jgi:tetratricopeptide (TPR) repeat protein